MSSAAVAADSVTEPLSRKKMHAVCQKRQNKPLIEKRRRARINDCLLQLKAILMKDMKKESPRPSKLEKADILEMTVDYIKKMAGKSPEPTDKECLTDRTRETTATTAREGGAGAAAAGGGGGGVPFLKGFSQCLEEVDSFLHSQLPQQPEVRHKLLSHCKHQLSARHTLTSSDTASPAVHSAQTSPPSSADSVPPSTPPKLAWSSAGEASPGQYLSDCASDLPTSEDEDKSYYYKGDVGVVEVKPTVGEPSSATATATATATAFVTPFQHTSSSALYLPPATAQLSSSPENNSSRSSSSSSGSSSNNNNNGIKLAGPLKLICGGNVFIVLDQQQPASDGVTTTITTSSSSSTADAAAAFAAAATSSLQPQSCLSSFSGPVACSPNAYSPASGGLATYLSQVPGITFPPVAVGLPLNSFSVAGGPLVVAGSSSPPTSHPAYYGQAGALTLPQAASCLSPPVPPLPEVSSPGAGNDVNNNVNVMNFQAVWRPW